MSEFTLMTDVNTDIPEEYAEKEGIIIMPQYYHFNDGVIYGDEIKLDSDTFYRRLEAGERAYSSGCNPARVEEMFTAELEKGRDIYCLIFSSGLSGSYNTAVQVGNELMEKYPGRKIIVRDSLNASIGAGLMLYMARDMQKAGKSIEEVDSEVERLKPDFKAIFMVNDLQYLVRGGRLPAAGGYIGTKLDIKPILHCKDGKLAITAVRRTRKRAIDGLMDILRDLDPDPEYFCVVHTNNVESARELSDRIREETGIPVNKIAEINPTIGTHTGPNALGFGLLSRKGHDK